MVWTRDRHGEDLTLEGRGSVRTWMQWSSRENGGFSDVAPGKSERKLIAEGEFSYKKVNVADQQRDSQSLLNWMRRTISFRRDSPEFGWGSFEVIDTNNPKILAHCCRIKEGAAIAIHNFSPEEQRATLEDDDLVGFIDMFGDKVYDPFDPKEAQILVMPYGYRWLCRRKT